MLIFDQLRKNDTPLQALAALICLGLGILAAWLWWVQIVSSKRFQESQEKQSMRTVRLPGVRGKILDRNGLVLADNQPNYNVKLYLEDLSPLFRKEYSRAVRRTVTNDLPFWKDLLGFNPVQTKIIPLTRNQDQALQRESRYRVADNVVSQMAKIMNTPIKLDYTNFYQHFNSRLAMPYPVINNLDPGRLASFAEQGFNLPGVDLEVQPQRYYPRSNVTAHILGYVARRTESVSNELAFYDYRLQDFKGLVGIEGGYDTDLRGAAGEKAVTVNNLGYRQTENIVTPVEAGKNIYLTLDFRVQAAADAAFRRHPTSGKGAVVVMDVWSGDILAMVSAPSMNPNYQLKGYSASEWHSWTNKEPGFQINRASAGRYQAGSIFKTIVALAALETPAARFNPNDEYRVEPNPHNPARGHIKIGNVIIDDTVSPGLYNLRRAIAKLSNAYFVSTGLRPGVMANVARLAETLHLGERLNLELNQEIAGDFPKAETIRKSTSGFKANLCIGQGEMSTTPTQIAVLIAAIANGGTVLRPRLIDRMQSQDPNSAALPEAPPEHQVRDRLATLSGPVSKKSFDILRDAMLSETEDPEGTGKGILGCGFRVCGKTGTAERSDKQNTTWFASFAPYETPRYAVVVAVENGGSGGTTCVPIARDVYVALKAIDAEYTAARATASIR